jgi:ElaB/YqjD/DUF883 family membrane-anchored ribosome-binding protein
VAMDMGRGSGTTTASTEEVLDGLNDLLQLDHDAIGSYEIAIEKLEDRDHASQISGFLRDHQRHIQSLNELIRELGGTPTNEPHATGPLKQAMQNLGALGGDKGILLAWRANELQVRTKYDGYASKANHWPSQAKRLVDENALDEERHYQWVVNALQGMGIGGGEGWETDLADKVREGAAAVTGQVRAAAANVGEQVRERASELGDDVRERASELGDQVRERAGDLATSARLRTADGLESAAHRLEDVAHRADQPSRAADVAGRVAGGMESTADYLRASDAGQMRSDVERAVREHPVQMILGTLAVGFLVGRLLR